MFDYADTSSPEGIDRDILDNVDLQRHEWPQRPYATRRIVQRMRTGRARMVDSMFDDLLDSLGPDGVVRAEAEAKAANRGRRQGFANV